MAYNSTSWTADGLSKATNSTSTNDSLSIDGTLTVGGASTLNSTLTVSGDLDIVGDFNLQGGDITTDAGDIVIKSNGNLTFLLDDDNDETSQSFGFYNDTVEVANLDESGNLQIDGDLTVTGGKITFGNAEYISNESDNFITLLTNPSSSGSAIISSAGSTQLQLKSINNDAHITFFNGGSPIWNIGYDYDDSNILKFDYGNLTGVATKLNLTSSGELILSGDGVVALKETTTPTAVADYGRIYTKNDNKLYFQDGAGTEHEISFA